MKRKQFITAGVSIIILLACHKDKDKGPQTYFGTTVPLGKGSVRAFVTIDNQGRPATIGLRLTEDALNGLPTDTTGGREEYQNPIPLPDQAKITGIDHMELDWNPYGHDPTAIYGVPHFDFHFYLISTQEQAGVIPGPDTFSVAKAFIPQDYFSGVVAVPDMGVHWLDSTSLEFHGHPFTDTYIYGFYHGKMTFMEPMITAAFLATHPDYSMNVKQPAAFQKSGYYPTIQQVQFDQTQHEYVVTLAGLVHH